MSEPLPLALGSVVVHLLTNGSYGFHRDELATFYDGRELAWGYVAYPPMTPFFGHLSVQLFGTSVKGFRFFSALASGLSIFFTGLMARELGGGRRAQTFAALATTPYSLGAGAAMHYVTFDCLFWVLTAYFFIRLLRSNDARWWLAVGSAIGLGMMAKYTMLFLVAGLVVGIMVTDAHRYLKNKWLWCGVGVSCLIFLPNFVWQLNHHFVTIDFLRSIHWRDVREGYTGGFFLFQFEPTLLAFPFAMAGLLSFLFRESRSRFRPLGWMYLVPMALFAMAQGRGYYLAPAYPMLFAEGSVWCEKWIASLRGQWNDRVRAVAWTVLLADIIFAATVGLPIAPVGST